MLDPLLLAGLQARDLKALETLYDRHAAVVWGFAVALAGREDWASQAVEAAFVAVWKAPADGRDPLETRLIRACLHALRRFPPLHAQLNPSVLAVAGARLLLQGFSLEEAGKALDLPPQDLTRSLRQTLGATSRLRPQTSTLDPV